MIAFIVIAAWVGTSALVGSFAGRFIHVGMVELQPETLN